MEAFALIKSPLMFSALAPSSAGQRGFCSRQRKGWKLGGNQFTAPVYSYLLLGAEVGVWLGVAVTSRLTVAFLGRDEPERMSQGWGRRAQGHVFRLASGLSVPLGIPWAWGSLGPSESFRKRFSAGRSWETFGTLEFVPSFASDLAGNKAGASQERRLGWGRFWGLPTPLFPPSPSQNPCVRHRGDL